MESRVFGVKILSEECSSLQGLQETRMLEFPDDVVRSITLPVRVWGWYDSFFKGRPDRRNKYFAKILYAARIKVQRKSTPLEVEIRNEMHSILLAFNGLRFRQNKKYIQ